MGRKKILMDYIKDDRKRQSTFEKRRIGLFKKATELNKLCGVKIMVKILNKNSLYQFSDSSKDDFSQINANPDLKIEENFTNDSFQEFLSKKSLSHKVSDGSICNDQHAHDLELLNSDDDEDQSFLQILKKKNVLNTYIELNRHTGQSQQLSSPDVISSSLHVTSDQNNQYSFPESLNSASSSISDLMYSYKCQENDTIYHNPDSVSFDNIIKTMQNDPAIFDHSNWESYKSNHMMQHRNNFYHAQSNHFRSSMKPPTLDSLMNCRPFSITNDFYVNSNPEVENSSGRSQMFSTNNINLFSDCIL